MTFFRPAILIVLLSFSIGRGIGVGITPVQDGKSRHEIIETDTAEHIAPAGEPIVGREQDTPPGMIFEEFITLPEDRIAEELPGTEPPAYAITYPAAIRTNLLFDLMGAPNLGVELPLGRRFSVVIDATYAYWRINNLYALQTIQGGIEARYRFNPSDKPLTGWHAGVYGIYGGRYDVQWKDGYQGNGFLSAGLSAGYSLPLSKSLNLGFTIAGGYFYTSEVRHYHQPENGHLLWEETRYNVGRLTPVKVEVNLTWIIKRKKVVK